MSREVEGDLKPCDVDEDGVWTLPDGSRVHLQYIEMTLPDERGKEKVSMVMMDLTGFVDDCPLCATSPTDGFTIFLEKHYYLALRCCETLLLYKHEENRLEDWI
tara:strand:- start:2220 stop:2531 length:312 start_codon:yes stop_codon:yes gene_type:complete